MNERIRELAESCDLDWHKHWNNDSNRLDQFAKLIVKEMCGLMEQTEDDLYHFYEPSERPTQYIEWLNDWRELFEKHFGVEE